MAPPVTEVATLALKPDIDIFNANSEAGQVWEALLKTLSQQKGFLRYRYGVQIENKSNLMWFIDWDSLADHHAFMASEAYGPFAGGLGQIISGAYLHHAITTPAPPSLLTEAPVIELATFFSIEDGFLENANKFVAACNTAGNDTLQGYHGIVVAEVIEDVAKGGAKEGLGKAVSLWIGWESVEAHMKFRETPLFAENVGLIRFKRGDAEMFHVAFKSGESGKKPHL